MTKGDNCWIIENGLTVTSVEIISITGNLVLVRMENKKVLRLPKHRIFANKEEAERRLSKNNTIQKEKTPYDYMM